MASITYRGSFNTTSAGASGLSATATGTPLPSGAVITNIEFGLDISAERYSSSKYWELHWFAVGDPDGSPYADEQTRSMSSSSYTFDDDMIFSQSDADKFTSGSFEVYAKANTTHDTKSYMGDFYITVEYEEHTSCGAPTSCSVNKTLATSNVTLSWSGASAGTGNAITGYEVQYRDSSDGSSWGSWTALKTVASTSTSASLSVSPPSTVGYYRQFRVRTQGAAGSSYYSGWKTSSNTVRRDHAALDNFTDSTLVAGSTPIKAIHMTELQNRVNTLRTFYGLSAYGFTTITAGTTKLSGWTSHVNEIRTAIDQVCTASGKSHETWINFTVNCPRADVIQQLRNVVLAL